MLSRQFREVARSRIEGLLASFPKLADSSTQHTTVEQDSVRYVYQPLDELYMVLITNRQSNILQDIDSLHLFAQVVTSICKSLDEREILRNAYELLSAFDELVTLGYRENLSLSQIKTFLEMESHEERIQEIISRVQINSSHEDNPLKPCRTKSLKLRRRGKGKPNNLSSNERRCPEVVGMQFPEHHHIPHIHHLLGPPVLVHTTVMKQRRISRSSQCLSDLLPNIVLLI